MLDRFLRPSYRRGVTLPAKVYFSYGMTKCGSTLAFQFTRLLHERNGFKQTRLSDELIGDEKLENFIEQFTPENLALLCSEVDQLDSAIVIKTHAPIIPEVAALLQNRDAIGQVVYRDPREMALSMLDHGRKTRALGRPNFAEFVTLGDAIRGIIRQMDNMSGWLRQPNVMPLYYDDFAWGGNEVLDPIRRQTGMNKTPEDFVERVKERRFTQRNKVQQARWRSEMTADESGAFLEVFAPFYKRLINRRWFLRNPLMRVDTPLYDRAAADKWIAQL